MRQGRFILFIFLFVIHLTPPVFSQTGCFQIARVRYHGGGDWYNDPSSIPNLSRFIRRETRVDIHPEEAQIALTDETLFDYPFLFLTGHGRWVVSSREAERLRQYCLSGGFLYVDDDYGLDKSFREVISDVFPGRRLEELPFNHPLYHIHFSFAGGLPKIHEHDNNPPRGFGLFDDAGRMMVFYTFETNLSDGWADADVHGDPQEKREEALKMGTNIVVWSLLQ